MASPGAGASGSLLLLENIVLVFVAKVVPSLTAAPTIVAHITAGVAIAVTGSTRASITPIAADGMFLEHSMSQVKIWFIVFHIIAAGILVLFVIFENKTFGGARSFCFGRGSLSPHDGTSIAATIAHETRCFSKLNL